MMNPDDQLDERIIGGGSLDDDARFDLPSHPATLLDELAGPRADAR